MAEDNRIGVIFDCDGTLLDSMGVWHDMDLRLAEIVGVEFTPEDGEFLTSCNIYECGEYLHGKYGLGTSGADVVDIINGHMMEFYKHSAAPRPGAMEFVRGLYELGVPLSVASSTVPALLHQGLETAGFLPYFRAVVSVDDVASSKREPAVYDRARAPLGTTRACTWGFEDALYAVRTLNASGYRTCGVYDDDISGKACDLERESDLFITSFTEISPKEFLQFAQEQAASSGAIVNGSVNN